MDYKSYRTDPRHLAYAEIMMARYKVKGSREPVTLEQCRHDLQCQRRRLFGTDKSLEPFLRVPQSTRWRVLPDIDGIELMTALLISHAHAAFFPYRYDFHKESVEIFIETALILISRHSCPGECTFDSILTLADCWERDPEVYAIVYENNNKDFTGPMADYYFEMGDYLRDYLLMHGDAGTPSDFAQTMAFALSCFLGKMYAKGKV